MAAGGQSVRRLPGLQPDGETCRSRRAGRVARRPGGGITGQRFFPQLIAGPFIHGLRIAFSVAFIMCLIAAWASWLRGGQYVADEDETGPFGAPEEARPEAGEAPLPEEWVPA